MRFRGSTIRIRLAITYAVLFLSSGVLMLGITYALGATNGTVSIGGGHGGDEPSGGKLGALRQAALHGPLARYAEQVANEQHAASLHDLLLNSGIALAVMTMMAACLGWLMAGRVLRPVRQMTARARQISDENLTQRLGITGPSDELKTLADTFDGMLGRLEQAFTAQRQFVANVSHELRTPLTLQRAMVEVALADPQRSEESLGAVCERMLVVGAEQERLIEALLTLAHSQRGLDRHEPVDLAGLLSGVLEARQQQAASAGVRLHAGLGPALTAGDARLVKRLATNLVDNAVRHNAWDGWVAVHTATRDGRAELRVANSGPRIAAEDAARLLEPFQRGSADRGGRNPGRDGYGLGLAIVAAIAAAHDADLAVSPRAAGGLEVTVSFPVVAGPVMAHAGRRDDGRGSALPAHAVPAG